MEERKNKYLGFRIGYADYMQTLEAAGRAGVSITDFILSTLLPAINKFDNKVAEKSLTDTAPPFLKQTKNITTSNTMSNDDNLQALIEKEKIYHQKIKTI